MNSTLRRDWLAPLIRRAIAPAWARWERSEYLAEYRRLRRTQFDSSEAIDRRQWESLQAMVAHAAATTPFYRERFAAAGVQPDRALSRSDFQSIPLLTKDDLRNHHDALRSEAYRDAPLRQKKTSGSTGVSVQVLVDEPAMQRKRAMTLRSDEWSGWRLGEPIAAVWGNPEYLQRGWRGRLRNQLLERAQYLDTLKMDRDSMQRFAASLRRRPPSLMFGHAHSLYLFAEFCRGLGGAGFQPRGIISTAMVLHGWERRLIEEVFACPVTNRYGCEEVSLIACECERHSGLHVNADGIYLEILRADGTPATAGECGAVVVTDLVNRAMPILRYRVGDMAVRADRPCECGRGLPLLERIEGRVADYVVTPAGDLVSGISLTENFAMLVPGLAQLQIVQERVDHFTFRIVRGHDFGPASEDRIRQLVLERFGPTVTHVCEFTDRILPEPSGKYRFCISKAPRGALMSV